MGAIAPPTLNAEHVIATAASNTLFAVRHDYTALAIGVLERAAALGNSSTSDAYRAAAKVRLELILMKF